MEWGCSPYISQKKAGIIWQSKEKAEMIHSMIWKQWPAVCMIFVAICSFSKMAFSLKYQEL